MMDELYALRREMEERFTDRILVHGEGRPFSKVALIGEAPGETEERERRPFVGKAGKNLDEFLESCRIERDELYITNTVKFRPTAEGKKGKVNRKPTLSEISQFRSYLIRELKIIGPKLIVTLGNVPLNAVVGDKLKIGDVHGSFMTSEGFTIFPLYHPASVIYNPKLRQVYIDDVQKLSEWIGKNA